MMINYELEQKINKFVETLLETRQERNEIKNMAKHLMDDVYFKNYRHSYAKITATIIHFRQTSNNSDCLDILGYNIQCLIEAIEDLEDDYTLGKLKPLIKLCDHINLEINRANYLKVISDEQERLKKNIDKTKKEIEKAEDNLRAERERLEKEKKELEEEKNRLQGVIRNLKKEIEDAEKLKPEIITIIGIFSAITLAFVGGMSFTSSTLANIEKASIYRTIFIACICGLVMFNTVFCLMYIVAKMLNRNIYAKCLESTKDCFSEKCDKFCSSMERIRKRLPYIYWINILLISLLFFDFIAWLYDIKFMSTIFRKYIAQIPEGFVEFISWACIILIPILIIWILKYLLCKLFCFKEK